MIDNLGKQSTEAAMPPKATFRFRRYWVCCGCLLAIPLLLIASIIIFGILGFYLPAFHPTRLKASFVEDHEIQNIMQELAGEWIIELSDPSVPVHLGEQKGWRETRFILNEDGTCEIRNLTLHMARKSIEMQRLTMTMDEIKCINRKPSDLLYSESDIQRIMRRLERRPELAGKVLTGTWKSHPQGVTGYVDGVKLPPEGKRYARIDIYVNVDTSIAHGNVELPTEDRWWLGYFMVWRVREWGKETYRLKVGEGMEVDCVERSGIIMKRVE